MAGFILKRLGLAVCVALAVSILAFLLLRLSGDPAVAIAGEGAPASVPASLPRSPQEGGAPLAFPKSNTVPGACSTGGIGAILWPVGASGYR